MDLEDLIRPYPYSQVGSGYTFKELLDFNLKLKDRWQRSQPTNVVIAKEKADVWIEPGKSAILQVGTRMHLSLYL